MVCRACQYPMVKLVTENLVTKTQKPKERPMSVSNKWEEIGSAWPHLPPMSPAPPCCKVRRNSQLELPPPFGPKTPRNSPQTPHKLPQSTIIRKYANMVRIGVHSLANSRSVRPTCCCCKVQTPLKLPIAPLQTTHQGPPPSAAICQAT